MARYIDVEPISSQYHNTPRRCESEYDIGYFAAIDKIDDDLNNAPTADVAPVVHAHWRGWQTTAFIGLRDDGEPKYAGRIFYRCSKCRTGTVVKTKCCPHCGALMDEKG